MSNEVEQLFAATISLADRAAVSRVRTRRSEFRLTECSPLRQFNVRSGSKADISPNRINVRQVPKADIRRCLKFRQLSEVD
jgi:hypothetical protein